MNAEHLVSYIKLIFTQDNINTALAVIGFIGTLLTFCNQKAKIDISITEYVPAKDSVILYVLYKQITSSNYYKKCKNLE